jgi:hypothetical protein
MAKTTAALNRMGAVESDIDERMAKTTAALNRVGAVAHYEPTRDTAQQPERDDDNTNERRTMAPTSFKIEIENYRTRARDPRAPPPQGGCPSISSRPSTESESENRKSNSEKFSSSSPPSPSSIKSPSSCSASHLKSRPSGPQSEYVSPKVSPQPSCLSS